MSDLHGTPLRALIEKAKAIKTWSERCEIHPDHQQGMVTHTMIAARMQEEIDELRDMIAAMSWRLDKLI